MKLIEPAFGGQGVPVVFASDDRYIPFLATAIASLVDHVSDRCQYDIVILHSGIPAGRRALVEHFGRENISIRFLDMDEVFRSLDRSAFPISGHISLETYYRLFIPELFRNYRKVVYLDSDVAVLTDIAQLYAVDIGDNILGAVKDCDQYIYPEARIGYMRTQLGLEPESYVNAGVLLINCAEANKLDFTGSCMETLVRIGKPLFHDQDILNALCRGRILFLDGKWNFQWHVLVYHQGDGEMNFNTASPPDFRDAYYEAQRAPLILHFTSDAKPWTHPKYALADIFWRYARVSGCHDEILERRINAGCR